jgi:hypothetical protein
VAVVVVDRLEPVDVDADHRDGTTVRDSRRQPLVQSSHERRPVRQPGQVIVVLGVRQCPLIVMTAGRQKIDDREHDGEDDHLDKVRRRQIPAGHRHDHFRRGDSRPEQCPRQESVEPPVARAKRQQQERRLQEDR